MKRPTIAMLFAGTVCALQVAAATYPVTGNTGDYAIAEGPPPYAVSASGSSLRTGANNNFTPGGRNTVLIFALPTLATNETIVSARLTVRVTGTAGTPTFNADLWGIGFQTSPAPVLAYFEADSGDPAGTKIEDNLFTPDTEGGADVTSTNGAALGACLQGFYATNAGYAGGAFAFLRLTPDTDAGVTSVGWSVASGESSNPSVLTIDTRRDALARTNFLLMITDDQRGDAMGVVLREQGAAARFPWFANATPNMDRLAAGGVRFRNAFVTLPLCSPSRAAILTGRYNHHNGIIDNGTAFPSNAVTFATQLRDAGYQTGWIGKFHMDSQTTRPGFTYYASYVGHGQYNNATFLVNGASVVTTGWVDDVSTDYALDFLAANQAQPFALVVGFKTPHSPRTPPARTATLYSNEVARYVPNLDHLAPYRTSPGVADPEDVRNYFRCIKAMDDGVGRLLDRLDALGLADQTFVLFCSDNGYYLGEHGLGDKRSMYDESMRIPLLVRYPPLVPAGLVRDEIVLNIDFAPTLLDLAGVGIPASMQGRSWRTLLAGGTVPDWRTSFFCEYFLESGYTTPTVLSARNLDTKVIAYPGHDAWTEFFDLAADPYETNNLIASPLHQAPRDALLDEFQRLARDTGLTPRFADLSLSPTGLAARLEGGIGPRLEVGAGDGFGAWISVATAKMKSASANVALTNTPGPTRFHRARMIGDN